MTLKPGDWIVVADFDNHTGESVLDGTLRAAVDRELEYSDFVRVAQRDRIEDALKLLERPLDSRLDRDLAQQLSQRDGGIHALVCGTIAKADNGYTLTSDIVNPATGTSVATLTDHAPAQADILAAVRRQVLRIREIFGEPATSIERSREAFQRAALPSLEALNLFAQAKAMINLRPVNPVSEWVTIEKFAREVIQADATFPGGPILLAWALTNQGRGRGEGQVHRERALLLADNATPQERYFIIASLHGAKARGPRGGRSIAQPRELEKAAAAMEALFALQPDHYALRGNLRNVYQLLGRERDLAWMNLRLADARPWSVDVNLEVANQLLREGNVDGARRYGARAESALAPGSSAADPNLAAGVRLFRAYVAWVEDDPSETLRALNQVAPSAANLPDSERRQLFLRIWPLYAAVGRLQAAEQAVQAIEPTDRGDLENAIVADMARADLLEDRGDLTRLRELAATAWRDPLPAAARPMLAKRVTFLIEAGLVDAAERDLQWFKQRTADPSAWGPRLPARQFEPFYASNAGAIELARGRPAAAAAALREVMPAIRDAPPPILSAGGSQGQYAALKLAAALDAIGNVSEAITTLEQAVADRVAVTTSNTPHRWLRAVAQLARLYRKNGKEAKARAIEAQLMKLLAHADADHPLVLELRGRR